MSLVPVRCSAELSAHRSSTCRLLSGGLPPCSVTYFIPKQISVPLKMKALFSSESSGSGYSVMRRRIPEDASRLHSDIYSLKSKWCVKFELAPLQNKNCIFITNANTVNHKHCQRLRWEVFDGIAGCECGDLKCWRQSSAVAGDMLRGDVVPDRSNGNPKGPKH